MVFEQKKIVVDFAAWNTDDDRALMEKVKAVSNSNASDRTSYKTRLKQIDWKEIAFKTYSPKDCKHRFDSHLRRVRHFRTLNEMIVDMQANIKNKRAAEGLSGYHIFVKEQLSNATAYADFVSVMLRMSIADSVIFSLMRFFNII